MRGVRGLKIVATLFLLACVVVRAGVRLIILRDQEEGSCDIDIKALPSKVVHPILIIYPFL